MGEIVHLSLVLWVMVVGFAYMVRGPQGASAVLRWPITTAFRLLRRTIGGALVALGTWVRGQPRRRR